MTRRTLVKRILLWAKTASSADPGLAVQHRLLIDQLDLLEKAEAMIHGYERNLVEYLVNTPFVLLMSITGINVVSAASYAAELGPMEHYTHPRKISGRAGLYASRYQSDEVDRSDGPMVKGRNARLRDALIEIAHNLIRRNPYFQNFARTRRQRGEKPRHTHAVVANRFCRISYWMVAGQSVFDHPCANGRDAIMAKLVGFANTRKITPAKLSDLLMRASAQIPAIALPAEKRGLEKMLPKRPVTRSSPTQKSEAVHISQVLIKVIQHMAASCSPADKGVETDANQQLGRSEG